MANHSAVKVGGGYRHIAFQARDGRELNGLLRTSRELPTDGGRALIHVHGLAGKPLGGNAFVDPMTERLQKQNVDSFLAERRGTGEKFWVGDRKLGATYETFNGAVQDTLKAVDAVRELGYNDIILSGFSLGATVVAAVAARHAGHTVSGVILESPTLLPAWLAATDSRHNAIAERAKGQISRGEADSIAVQDHRGYDMAFTAGAYDSLAHADLMPYLLRLAALTTPTMVIYGDQDSAVLSSYGSSQEVDTYMRDAYPNSTLKLHRIEGAGHDFAGYEPTVTELVGQFVLR